MSALTSQSTSRLAAGSRPRLRILSHGGGVQTSTLGLMIARGDLPSIDGAVFADTQHEPKAVYEYLDWFEEEVAKCRQPFPIYRVTNGDLWKAATEVRISRVTGSSYIRTAIPVYTLDGLSRGIGRRQCTTDYKIKPVQKKAKQLLGVKRIRATDGVLVEMLIGFSTDEIFRLKPSRESWIEKAWPLIELNMSRADCYSWMEKNGYPRPLRSACEFCPFHSDQEWLGLGPQVLSHVANREKELQHAYHATGCLTSTPFLHENRIPFADVVFNLNSQRDLYANDCNSGFCGT